MAYIYSETIFILFADKLYFAINHTHCVLPFLSPRCTIIIRLVMVTGLSGVQFGV